MKRIVSFLLAGGIGFAVDAGVLLALTAWLGFDPFLARIASVATAILATFLINRSLTFGPSGRPLAAEGARYGGVAIGVALFNYAVYAALLLIAPGMPPIIALIIASAAAMALSFAGYSKLVFARRRGSPTR
jgi:putative flippase GtrA